MPHFRYNAIDSSGKWVTGEVDGPDREQVEIQLSVSGLVVESLIEAEAAPGKRGRIASEREVAELVEQLAALTRSGMPLASGLRAAAHEMMAPSVRSTFLELADKLDSGANLDEALRSSSSGFPAHLRGLVLAGSRSGRLADLLGEYVRSVNLGAELRRLFWATLAYPLLALVLVMGIVGFVCSLSIKVVDSLLGNLGDPDTSSPANVEFLIAMARFISGHGLELLGGFLLVTVAGWATFRFTSTAAGRRRILCSVPVLGPIVRFIALTEFCHLLAMLIESDLPLPLAFELAGASVRDAEVSEACSRMGRAVSEGDTLRVAVRQWEAIPAGLGQLFRWSEAQNSLPQALHLAGDMFESRARGQSSFAGSVMATSLLLLILWWVGFAIASLYLPLISLISRLSG